MGIIRKKVWKEYFEKILAGEKNFELRLDDFPVQVGDVVLLEEYDPFSKTFSGRTIEKTVKHISRLRITDFWTVKDIEKTGIVVMEF